MAKGKGESQDVVTLTDLLSDVFRIGYKAGSEEAFKDADHALEDGDIEESLTSLHEKYGNQIIKNVEAFLDMAEDDEPETDDDTDKKNDD